MQVEYTDDGLILFGAGPLAARVAGVLPGASQGLYFGDWTGEFDPTLVLFMIAPLPLAFLSLMATSPRRGCAT